jgi:hypothetical protein
MLAVAVVLEKETQTLMVDLVEQVVVVVELEVIIQHRE